MNPRDKATYCLLDSLLDYLPMPKQSSGTLETIPGLSESRRVPCSTCGARGRVVGAKPCPVCRPKVGPTIEEVPSHRCDVCLACNGDGWRLRKKGEQAFDEYTGTRLLTRERAKDRAAGVTQKLDVPEPRNWRDTEKRVDAQVAQLESIEPAFGWERQQGRYWAAGSYAELTTVLFWLRSGFPNRHRLVWQIIVCHERPVMDVGAFAALLESVSMVSDRMPTPIRVPSWLSEDEVARARKPSLWHGRREGHEEQRQSRNQEIIARAEEGWSFTKIAHRHGLTPQRVSQIVSRSVATAAT